MRFFFWLCFVVYWSFLILAPLNAFAADKTFTCKPVVAGSPKKDGSFYVEDIDDESTPMLDVTPISQLLVRGMRYAAVPTTPGYAVCSIY